MGFPLTAAIAVCLALAPHAAFAEDGALPSALFDPPAHADGFEDRAGPLDLGSVTFGQRGVEMVLRVTTAGPWTAQDLRPGSGRSICLQLYDGTPAVACSRICATGGDAITLSIGELAHPTGVRVLPASVSRPDPRSIEATFTASDAGLALGPYRWLVETGWTDTGRCPPEALCRDRFPNGGAVRSRAVVLARPRCFGAAARATSSPCVNERLTHIVVPRLRDAPLQTSEPCLPVGAPRLLDFCEFQDPPRGGSKTFALVGDSHAAHWRAGLNVFARARGWRGISMSRTGCPFSTAVPLVSAAKQRECARFRRRVLRFIAERPDITLVFVSNNDGASVVVRPGQDRLETEVAGVNGALRMLATSVRHVVVIRDPPGTTLAAQVCLERALRRHRRTERACATPRGASLRSRDPAAIAASRMSSKRMSVFDMTRFFCDRHRCFPVIGGALVHKDTDHLTTTYSQTLGPFLRKRIDALLRAKRGGRG